MQALLVIPPTPGNPSTHFDIGEYLGVGYISSYLAGRGLSAPVLDCTLGQTSYEQATDLVMNHRPRVVGLSAPFVLDLVGALMLAKHLRRRGYAGHICLGGQTPTLTAAKVLSAFQEIDSICIGEGEETFLQLVRASEQGRPLSTIRGLALDGTADAVRPRALIESLDTLPFPNRASLTSDGLPGPEYFRRRTNRQRAWGVLGSRGCPYSCTFCGVQAFYRSSPGAKWRPRSADNIVDEIVPLVEQWGAKRINFYDDNFLGTNDDQGGRILELAGLLQRTTGPVPFNIECRPDDVIDNEHLFAELKAAGLYTVALGIETGIANLARLLAKRFTIPQVEQAIAVLKGLELDVSPNYILTYPFITLDELRETRSFLERTKLYRNSYGINVFVGRLAVFAGTPLESILRTRTTLIPERPHDLSPEERKIFEQTCPVWTWEIEDPGARRFFRVFTPMALYVYELFKEAVSQQLPDPTATGRLNRWIANLGILCLRMFSGTLDLILKDGSDTRLVQLWMDALTTYDHYFLGSTFRDFMVANTANGLD